MRKQIFASITILILLSILLSACGGTATPETVPSKLMRSSMGSGRGLRGRGGNVGSKDTSGTLGLAEVAAELIVCTASACDKPICKA